MPQLKKYRIMSFDGGGILGALSAEWLARTFPGSVEAELFAGSSTGAIIAAALAWGGTPQSIAALYRDLGDFVFKRRGPWDTISSLGGLSGAKYALAPLLEALELAFHRDLRLGDLPGKVLIPTFDLDCNGRWRSKIQTNTRPGDPDLDLRVVDAVARSCAAPTYFASHQGFIDGAIVATNPALCAIAEAIHGGASLDAIHCLSVGTYDSPKAIKGESLDWGLAQWAKPISRVLLDAGGDVTNFQARQLLGNRYTRVSFEGGVPVEMDDVQAVYKGNVRLLDALPSLTHLAIADADELDVYAKNAMGQK